MPTQTSIYELLDEPDPTPPKPKPVTYGTASSLIERHVCSAACMTASRTQITCTCPCESRFHGLLSEVVLRARS